MIIQLFGNPMGRGSVIALLMLAFAVHSIRAQTSHAQSDSAKPQNVYVLDSAFADDLYPDISFQFGVSAGNGMAGLNPLIAARNKIIRDSGFSVPASTISIPQTVFQASVRVKIINSFSLLGELTYGSTYSLSLSAIYTMPSQWVVPYIGFGVGYYAFSQQFNYGVSGPTDASGGYYMLDDVIYSGAAFGYRWVAGLDLFPLSSLGLGCFAANNTVSVLKDPVTSTLVNLSGYEFGIRITLNFWAAHNSQAQGNQSAVTTNN